MSGWSGRVRLSMLEIVEGNIWNVLEPGDVFVHGCNMQNVMGSGIALQVKERVPEAYKVYMQHKDKHLGEVSSVRKDGILYVNGITQRFYGNNPNTIYVNYIAVRYVLAYARDIVAMSGALSSPIYNRVIFPFIGGGRGNGDHEILMQVFRLVFDHSVKGILVMENK